MDIPINPSGIARKNYHLLIHIINTLLVYSCTQESNFSDRLCQCLDTLSMYGGYNQSTAQLGSTILLAILNTLRRRPIKTVTYSYQTIPYKNLSHLVSVVRRFVFCTFHWQHRSIFEGIPILPQNERFLDCTSIDTTESFPNHRSSVIEERNPSNVIHRVYNSVIYPLQKSSNYGIHWKRNRDGNLEPTDLKIVELVSMMLHAHHLDEFTPSLRPNLNPKGIAYLHLMSKEASFFHDASRLMKEIRPGMIQLGLPDIIEKFLNSFDSSEVRRSLIKKVKSLQEKLKNVKEQYQYIQAKKQMDKIKEEVRAEEEKEIEKTRTTKKLLEEEAEHEKRVEIELGRRTMSQLKLLEDELMDKNFLVI